jgi:hypothetical protein
MRMKNAPTIAELFPELLRKGRESPEPSGGSHELSHIKKVVAVVSERGRGKSLVTSLGRDLQRGVPYAVLDASYGPSSRISASAEGGGSPLVLNRQSPQQHQTHVRESLLPTIRIL